MVQIALMSTSVVYVMHWHCVRGSSWDATAIDTSECKSDCLCGIYFVGGGWLYIIYVSPL